MELLENREKIDIIDRQILKLVSERTRHVLAIGDYKKIRQLPVFDPDREAKMIATLTNQNHGPLSNEAIENIFRTIIKESRQLESDTQKSHPESNE